MGSHYKGTTEIERLRRQVREAAQKPFSRRGGMVPCDACHFSFTPQPDAEGLVMCPRCLAVKSLAI